MDLKNYKVAWEKYQDAMYIHRLAGWKFDKLSDTDLRKASSLDRDLRKHLQMENKNPTPVMPEFPVLHTQYEPCDVIVRPDHMLHKDLITFDNEADGLPKDKTINQDFQPGV